ncbi:MAG: TetR/AcrR family transcriptional regulator [Eubacteriales bacterium]|nr:TetR/AcrR family transcriptional regulator [Eubacteriales bacterium]
MMERKTDLRVQKTRNAIRDTFKEMIIEKEASEITVKELTERAMIHRKTFYLHYTCIEALYEDILSELAEKYYEVIDQVPGDAPFTEVNRVFFEFMAAQEPYMEKIVCDYSYREFSDRFFMRMLQHNRSRHNPYAAFSQDEQNIINTFLGVSSVNLYRQWVQDGKSLPLNDLIELSGKLFYTGISSVL